MTDRLGALLAARPSLRRLSWRLGRRLYSSARGEQIALEIESDGEAYLQARVIANVPSEARLRVFDIGANQGDWTRHLISQLSDDRRSKDRAHIDLFEPVPATRARLAAALSAVDQEGICEVHSLAMSNTAGRFKMAIMSETGGTNSLHFDGSAEDPPGGWVSVDTQTIVDFCALRGIAHVHLVKCDTEGHDLKVIEGAQALLAESRIDVMQFEYNHRWVFSRSFLKDVFELVKGLPYCLGKLEPRWIEIYDAWHPELDRFFQSNYVLVSATALDWFDVRYGTFDGSNTYA